MEVTQNSHLVDIYSNMVAGSFPLAEGVEPDQSIRMQAQEILHCQDVHFRLAIADGFVYYLAVNSRALASAPGFATPLAAGLPDHPNHKGDGCYYLPLPLNNAVAVVRRGNTLKLYSNMAETVLETCETEELPRHDLNESSAEPLQSQAWIHKNLSTKVANMASVASLAVSAVCVAVILISSGVSGYLSKSHASDLAETAEKANAIIQATPFIQPLAEHLNRIQTLAYASVRAGGWIDGYNYKPTSGERYVVSLPGWVTQEVVKTIGEGVKTEAQPSNNMIWVIKKDSLGVSVKDKGPAQIAVVPPAPSPATGAVKAAPAASAV